MSQDDPESMNEATDEILRTVQAASLITGKSDLSSCNLFKLIRMQELVNIREGRVIWLR